MDEKTVALMHEINAAVFHAEMPAMALFLICSAQRRQHERFSRRMRRGKHSGSSARQTGFFPFLCNFWLRMTVPSAKVLTSGVNAADAAGRAEAAQATIRFIKIPP